MASQSNSEEEVDFGSLFSQPVKKKSFVPPYSASQYKPEVVPDPPTLDFLSSQAPASQHPSPSLYPFKSQKFSHPNRNPEFDSPDILSDYGNLQDTPSVVNTKPHQTSQVSEVRRQLFAPTSDGTRKNENLASQAKKRQRFQTPSKTNLTLTQQPFELESPSNAVISVPSVDSNNENINLRSVSEIPEKFRKIFSFPYFNVVQTKVFDNVFYSDKPLVVCAPTGSGKTVLFELAIIRMLLCSGGDANLEYKIVYMAPIKALCSERHEDWSNKFGTFGLTCTELTGDTDLDDFHVLQSSHIVLTTPEKWDSMTRKWKDNKSLVQAVRLFLIDEVHLLSDESRGATMEAVVSRMKTVQKFIKKEISSNGDKSQMMRIIAVSATIPNVEDIADWLTIDDCRAEWHNMGDEYRPVTLRKVVLGYPFSENSSDFKFDMSLDYKLSGVIQTYSDNKPTIVFCSTRKGTTQAAVTLTKDARFIMDVQHRGRLVKYSNSLHDAKLRDLVLYGVGYHHAGMDMVDRKNIESMFVRGELPVLFCTSTLAMGVNLPAHLVIVKSTMHYVMGMYDEYSESQVLQMIGRAGRPQFDTSATAVIMTKATTKAKYQSLINGMQKIESSLHRHLTEHVNAEIVLNTITSVSMTNEWLKSTFLYKRMQRNPKQYGAPEGLNEDTLGKKLQAMGVRALKSLQSLDLLEIKENSNLYPTETGKLMARYCIAFDTVKSFSKLKGTESIEELVDILSKSKEFEDITLRVNEKKILNTLNKDKHRATIRFPMKNKIKTTDQKINCLIQAVLGCLTISEFSLLQDIAKIFRFAQRVCRFLTEFLLMKGHYRSSLNAVVLCKCVRTRLWENSKFVSRQLDKIGPSMSSAMVNAGLTSLEKIEETNPRQIELIVSRNPPFGSQVKDALSALPKYDIAIDQDEKYQKDSADLYVKITMLNFEQRSKFLKSKKLTHQHSCLLMIGDFTNNIAFKQRLMDSFFLQSGFWSRHIKIKRAQRSPQLTVNLISSDYVGVDLQLSFTPHYAPGFISINQAATPTNLHQNMTQQIAMKDSSSSRNNVSDSKQRRPCTHRCINKDWCGHQCCKYGIEIKKPKRTSDDSENQIYKRVVFDIELDQNFSTSKLGSDSQNSSKPIKKKVSEVDGYLESTCGRASFNPRAPGTKRFKIDNPAWRSSYFDNDDNVDDEDLIEAVPSPPASKLEKSFSYKPKRVDFKTYLKEVTAMDRIKPGNKVEMKKATPRSNTMSQISHFEHLRSGGKSSRNCESDAYWGQKSTGGNDSFDEVSDVGEENFNYNFDLLDDKPSTSYKPSTTNARLYCDTDAKILNFEDDIDVDDVIDVHDDDDYDDQICPEIFKQADLISDDDDDEILHFCERGMLEMSKKLDDFKTLEKARKACNLSTIPTSSYQNASDPGFLVAADAAKALKTQNGARNVALHPMVNEKKRLPLTQRRGPFQISDLDSEFSHIRQNHSEKKPVSQLNTYRNSIQTSAQAQNTTNRVLANPPPQTPGAGDFTTERECAFDRIHMREKAQRMRMPVTPFTVNETPYLDNNLPYMANSIPRLENKPTIMISSPLNTNKIAPYIVNIKLHVNNRAPLEAGRKPVNSIPPYMVNSIPNVDDKVPYMEKSSDDEIDIMGNILSTGSGVMQKAGNCGNGKHHGRGVFSSSVHREVDDVDNPFHQIANKNTSNASIITSNDCRNEVTRMKENQHLIPLSSTATSESNWQLRYTKEVKMRLASNDCSMQSNTQLIAECSASSNRNELSAVGSSDSMIGAENQIIRRPSPAEQNKMAGSFTVNWFVADETCQTEEDNFDFCD